jgi:hypothetical protein
MIVAEGLKKFCNSVNFHLYFDMKFQSCHPVFEIIDSISCQ